ncbi:unnamed protein product, partial [Scytosiphon promiscuus]
FTRPLHELVGRMRSLREGDTQTPVPGTGRSDEVGEMAVAVDAFREAAIERETMAIEQEQEEASKIRRQQRIEQLIARFRDVIAQLLEQAAATNATFGRAAETLSHNAASTSDRTTAASNASQEASENVQSVASAAEELAASIAEISRQVGQTTQVVTDATTSAQDANLKVSGL